MSSGSYRIRSVCAAVSASHSKEKLLSLLAPEHYNKVFDLHNTLLAASSCGLVSLYIPETLFVESGGRTVFLHTDTEGRVRTNREKDSAHAIEQFIYACIAKQWKLKNANPHRYPFPKYVSFSAKGVEKTFRKQRELKEFLKQPFEKVQRFVVSAEFAAHKQFIVWNRTKLIRSFTLTPLLKGDTITPDDFLVSLKMIDNLRIKEEDHVSDNVYAVVTTLIGVVERFVLEPHEQLEELSMSVMSDNAGNCCLLNASKLTTSIKEAFPVLPRSYSMHHRGSLPNLKDIEMHIFMHEKFRRIVTMRLPEIAPPPDDFSPIKLSQEFHSECPHKNDFAARRLSEVAESMDKLCETAKARKEVATFLQKIKFRDYPVGFLQNCIARMYESIANEPKIAKFFEKNEQMTNHIKASITQVFLGGRYISRIKAAHCILGITESDFALYITRFGRAFREEGASEEHTAMAITFLETFKELVVTRRRVRLGDMSLEEDSME